MKHFAEFFGQPNIIALLSQECKSLVPRHTLLVGPPGLGKTTLAGIMAHESGMQFHKVQAGKLMTPKKVATELMELSTEGYGADGRVTDKKRYARHLVFIDEAHALQDFEQWHDVLTSRTLSPDPFGGVSWLPFMTVVCATNYPNRLPKPFRDRFSLQLRLEHYDQEDIEGIVKRAFPKLEARSVTQIASRARGSARRALDLAETVRRHGETAFSLLEIDDQGLTPIDYRYLDALRTAGRALSLSTLAGMIQEDQRVVSDEIEPYLLKLGLIARTSKGRELIGSMKGSRGVCFQQTPIGGPAYVG